MTKRCGLAKAQQVALGGSYSVNIALGRDFRRCAERNA